MCTGSSGRASVRKWWLVVNGETPESAWAAGVQLERDARRVAGCAPGHVGPVCWSARGYACPVEFELGERERPGDVPGWEIHYLVGAR